MKNMIIFFILLMLTGSVQLYATDYGNPKACNSLKRYLNNAYSVTEVRGVYCLEDKKIVQSNLFVVDANSEIDGIVEGNLVALNSNVRLLENAELYGDLVLVNSELRDDGGKIYGKIVHIDDNYLISSSHRRSLGFAVWHINDETGESELQFGRMSQSFYLLHNRTQGFFIGMKWPDMLGNQFQWINLNLNLGYGFSDKKFRYSVGFKRALGKRSPFYLGFAFYDKVDSYDKWKLTTLENTLASFTYKQDFFDYFQRKGWNASLYYESIPFKLSFGYRMEEQRTARENTDWSLFVRDRLYRNNPAASEGTINYFYFRGSLSTVKNPAYPHRGIKIKATGESAFSAIGSDYSYNFADLTLFSYIPLSEIETINMRLYGGTLAGDNAPVQRLFRTGGIGTVRGFSLNSQMGNRSLLATVEYRLDFFNGRKHFGNYGPWRGGVAVFTDFGSTLSVDGNREWYEGFDSFHINNFQNSVGLSFFLGRDFIRIDIAKRTDRGFDSVYGYIRLKTAL